MRHSKAANWWRRNICPRLKGTFICNNMKGALCPDSGGANGTLYPIDSVQLGVQLFAYPDWAHQFNKAAQLPINRIRTWITEKNYNQEMLTKFLYKAKSLNISVLLCLWNEDDPYLTYQLAEQIAQNHAYQQDLYLYEIGNEVNDHATNSFMPPENYFTVYKRCFEVIRQNREDTHIFPAGLICSEKADIPCSTYIARLKKAGIEKYIKDPIRASGWNLHAYMENLYELEGYVKMVKHSKDDVVFLTESGCAIGYGFPEQKDWFNTAVQVCKKCGIIQYFHYGLAYAGNPARPGEDYSLLEVPELTPRPMFDYIRIEGASLLHP